ncbi:FecR family protein [uncultured Lacinutrix sp.]|uniref:FecR family protein n=1 Tax=uncultured Lacinutrix sp. TaxID=574032 RepID=UPI002617B59B|nr:FecR family protein [uncultured Lacinutrix sp.]
MEKEELIKKWLDNDLSPEELKAFKALEDYESLIKLSSFTKEYKAPDFDAEATFNTISHKIGCKKQSSKNWLNPLLKVAAILAICLSTYYYTTTLDTNYRTELAQKTNVELPDLSIVNLNALSKITFNKKNWKKNREVLLEGEAFFKVAKGSTFHVKTENGIVSVLGTQFNVKQRLNYFEVICYEGLVEVAYNNLKMKLKPGESFLSLNKKTTKANIITNSEPYWLNNMSAFKSVPLANVLNEFERQYDVIIDASKIDTSKIYTGKFTHNNIEIAIKAITQPLQLNYTKKNNTIILSLD